MNYHLYKTNSYLIIQLSSAPASNSRTIAMCCKNIYRPVIIKCRIKCHSCSYTCSFYLSFIIDLCCYCIPCQYAHRCIGHCINPAFITGMCNAISINSCCGCFQDKNHFYPTTGARNLNHVDNLPVLLHDL